MKRSNSFFDISHLFKLPEQVLFLDFDDTVAIPKRKKDGNYDAEADGFIPASYMDKDKFKETVQLAIKNDIPLYFVTGRPDIPRNRELFHNFVKDVDGFHEGLGGFKKDSFYFISKMVEINGKLEWQQVFTKLDVISEIHHTKHKHLDKGDMLFVDDMGEHLEPVRIFGYQTLQVEPNDLSHFQYVNQFITHSEEHDLVVQP